MTKLPSRSVVYVAGFLCVLGDAVVLPGQVLSRAGAGGAIAATGGGWQPQVALDGEIVSPAVEAVRASIHAAFARSTGPSALLTSELVTGVRVSSLLGQGGVWLGTDLVWRRAAADAIERPRLTTGGWQRFGGVVLSVSASRRATRHTTMTYTDRIVSQPPLIRDSLGKIDTILRPDLVTRDSAHRTDTQQWTETEATLLWERRRWSGSLALGGRLPSRGVPKGVWTSADIAVAFAPSLSLVVGASVSPGARYFPASEHRYVTLGLRVAPRFFRSRAMPAPSAPLAAAFTLDSAGMGRFLITVRAPRARRVELSGDFTGWKPVSLRRERGDAWTVTLPLGSGTHRLNIRIDGGAWVAPPGVMTTSDDFAGEVGLIVVDERGRIESK